MAAKKKAASKAHSLAGMRILISNDDGIHSPGIEVLEKVARSISDDVWVVAPETEQSATGHSLTLRRPLRIRKLPGRRKRFAVDGTPTDCVLLAINEIMKDGAPDIMLSGVNRGGNLGDDVTYSGTVAAAMEAAILGIPAIAFSQDMADGHPCKWATAEHHLRDIMDRLGRTSWPKNVLINVNFPDVLHGSVQGVSLAKQGTRKVGDIIVEGRDPRDRPYYWIGSARNESHPAKGTDLAVTEAGMIAVTPLCLDLTHKRTMKALKDVF